MTFSLYEAHLPVTDLHRSIVFYESLGLTFDHTVDDRIAFLWIEPGKSWLGLWLSEHANTPYHPSIRHIALTVDIDFYGMLRIGCASVKSNHALHLDLDQMSPS